MASCNLFSLFHNSIVPSPFTHGQSNPREKDSLIILKNSFSDFVYFYKSVKRLLFPANI